MSARLDSVLHHIRKVLGAKDEQGSDADLLQRFVRQHDETAFELLLWRHAAMVLRVCQGVLRDSHAAEDAFQATFLALARKAASISRSESLAGWLYQVAYRVAVRARLNAAERRALELRRHERRPPTRPIGPDAEAAERDLVPLVHEELNRLSAKYRTPIVLCYLEGKTHAEAAEQLGWAKGTVSGRLARGREMLKKRLIHRGVLLPAAVLGVALAAAKASAVPPALVAATAHAAVAFAAGNVAAAGVSTGVIHLSYGVLHAMCVSKIKATSAAVIAFLLIFAGAGALVRVGLGSVSAQGAYAADGFRYAPQPTPPAAWPRQPVQAFGGPTVAGEPEDAEYQGGSPGDPSGPGVGPPGGGAPAQPGGPGGPGSFPGGVGPLGPGAGGPAGPLGPGAGGPIGPGSQGPSGGPGAGGPMGPGGPGPVGPGGGAFGPGRPGLGQGGFPGGPMGPGGMGAPMGNNIAERKNQIDSSNKLKQIALAFHNYHDAWGALPADIVDDNGRPLLSWRVVILPYIEQMDLYKQFKLDEPWDSPNNRKLLTKMPPLYHVQTAGDDGGNPVYNYNGPNPPPVRPVPADDSMTNTFYQGFSGKGTLFDRSAGPIRLTNITDGTSNTLLVVEAGSSVPWSKPQDLPYNAKKALPKLGVFPNVIHAVFADGAAHNLRTDFDEKEMRKAILRDDGEVLDMEKLELPAMRPGGGPPGMGMPGGRMGGPGMPGTRPGMSGPGGGGPFGPGAGTAGPGGPGSGTLTPGGDLNRLRQENAQLEQLLAQTAQDMQALRDEMARMKELFASRQEQAEAKKLLADREKLRQALEQATAELQAMREELQRLKRSLERP